MRGAVQCDAMSLEELVAQARESRPSLAGLRKLFRTLLSAFDDDAMLESGPGVVCRALAEVGDLRQRHRDAR